MPIRISISSRSCNGSRAGTFQLPQMLAYGLDVRGIIVRFPAGEKVLLCTAFRYSVSCAMDTGGLFR
jgi:hypothetical protein